MKIDSSEITVIVRGLVVGQNESDPQKRFTERSLRSVRKFLPNAQIILSTWKGSNTENLDCDELILNDEPEKIFMSLDSENTKFIAGNNQIFATQKGLEKTRRPYVISMRSDIIFTRIGFLSYFEKYNKVPPYDILEKRILTLPTYNPKRTFPFLFDVCDWFYFGTKKDIENLFTIPLMQERDLRGEKMNAYFPLKENLESEQYIWTTFLKKNGYPANLPSLNATTPELLVLSEQSYARYTIMVPAPSAGIICLKMPYAGYGARPWLSQGLYTFNEYKKMYNIYNSDKVFRMPNLFESLAYMTSRFARKSIANISPSFYKKIVNIIRKSHQSNNLLK